jgi:hypothetical protein
MPNAGAKPIADGRPIFVWTAPFVWRAPSTIASTASHPPDHLCEGLAAQRRPSLRQPQAAGKTGDDRGQVLCGFAQTCALTCRFLSAWRLPRHSAASASRKCRHTTACGRTGFQPHSGRQRFMGFASTRWRIDATRIRAIARVESLMSRIFGREADQSQLASAMADQMPVSGHKLILAAEE